MADPIQSQPFTVQASHDGLNVDGFKFYINHVLTQTKPASGLVSGIVSFDVPGGLASGTYTLGVTAYNAAGESVAIERILVVMAALPNAPSNIVVIVG